MKEKINTLFLNGKIYTIEKEGECVEALAVHNGKILFAGSKASAEEHFEAEEVVDLKGKTVLPGLGDSHLHFYATCQTLLTIDLRGTATLKEAMALLDDGKDTVSEGFWIKGFNFDESKWSDNDGKMPTRYDLDKVSDTRPIILWRTCLHTAVINSTALKILEDRGIEMNDENLRYGIFREDATRVLENNVPDPMDDPKIRMETMEKALNLAASKGLTMIHSYSSEITGHFDSTEDYEALDKEGKLPVRMTVCPDILFDRIDLAEEEKANPYIKVTKGAFKLFTDGSLGSRTAALIEPYSDDDTAYGVVVQTQDELNNKMLTSYERGLQTAIHAIGDRAMDMTLTAIEHAVNICGMPDKNEKRPAFRIIHAQILNEDLIDRMTKLPVILDIQPSFLCTDLYWLEERVGKERLPYSYCWKTLQNRGLLLAGGSDCPVESYDPFLGIYAAVMRTDIEGSPEGGYLPDEKMSVYDAVCLYCKNIPYANGEQDYLGTLAEGKFADLVVIDKDPFEIEPAELLKIKVEQTYVAGQLAYNHK